MAKIGRPKELKSPVHSGYILEKAQKAKLNKLARKVDRSASDLMREALGEMLKRYRVA